MPFGVKADLEVAGYVNTMGMTVNKSFDYFNTPAKESIWPVRKLEEVGAIMVGKMNQRESCFSSEDCSVRNAIMRAANLHLWHSSHVHSLCLLPNIHILNSHNYLMSLTSH